MNLKLFFGSVIVTMALSVPINAAEFDVAKVLKHSAHLQKTRGYVSDHVEGGHTHFDIVAADGTQYEICPHPHQGVLHIMQGNALPGLRLVLEVNLDNEVSPYNKNPYTTFMHANELSRSGLRFMADKAMKAIIETTQ